jgi:hypothetical protein
LKPGDYGEDTISLHVDTNDAYLCANVTLTSNDDNGINEPEGGDGDTTDGLGAGELAQNVNFMWWADDGDNVLETGENIISTGPIGALTLNEPYPFALADSDQNIWTGTGGPIKGNETLYIGKAWCFGSISASPLTDDDSVGNNPSQDNNGNTVAGEPIDGGYLCNGSQLNNITQTDSLTANVSFSAIQSRNNTGFQCDDGHCPIVTNNILVPGAGFEAPVVADPQLWDVYSSPTGGWNVAWRSDVPATFGPQNRPAVAKLEFHRGVLGASSEGQQYTELDSDWGGPNASGSGEPASVKIYQDIATVPGKNYEIHYAFAPRPNTPASENNLEFRFGGVVQNVTGPVAGGGGPIAWQQIVVNVVATTTTTRIEFTDLGTPNSTGTFLDDVRVYTESCAQLVKPGI